DHHLLVARGGDGGAGRLRVAGERVQGLGIHAVGPARGRAPAVSAGGGTIPIGARLQVREVREGVVRRKDDGGSHLHEGRDAQAVFVAVRVLEGEAGEVAVAGDDVGVDGAVPVAALDG